MDAARERLIAEHVDYVRALAHQLVRTLPSKPDMEDLIAFGLEGLAEAAARYDASKGAAFKTFAYYRIRGSMFDGLRGTGWLARSDHARVKAQQQADDLLEAAATVPGTVTPDAVRAAGALRDLLADVTAIVVASVDSFDRMAADPTAEGGAAAIEQALTTRRTRAAMDRAMQALPDKERELLRRVYYDDETIERAGQSLGISKSWASRMHARAIRRMREVLEGDATVLAEAR